MPQQATAVARVCAALLDVVVQRGGDAGAPAGSPLQQYDAAVMPRVSLEDYICRWAQYAECGDNEILVAVVYIDRVCTRTGLRLTQRNAHRVLLAALLAATKWREEHPFKMSYYAKIGGVDHLELLRLEARFVSDLGWRMHVDPDVTEKYLDKLRVHPKWTPAGPERRIASAPVARG